MCTYAHKKKFTFHDTQKIPRKIYAPFACLKGKMIAMKKHFYIQSIHVCLLCNLYFIRINMSMWCESYSIRSYTNQSLNMKRKSFYTASEYWCTAILPHGDILMGPRHQLLIINISHLSSLIVVQTLLGPVSGW